MSFPKQQKAKLFADINAGHCSVKKVEAVARELSFKACPSKLKLDMESAAERYGRYPSEVDSLYICEACGWLHAGHSPRWKSEAVRIIVAKTETKKRKPKVNTPRWKLDPRRSDD
jgi:uncharacterized Zn finger protein